MLKNKTVLEVKLSERFYSLECDPDSPLGELYDAISQMQNFVIEKIQEHAKMSCPKESCKDKCSEVA